MYLNDHVTAKQPLHYWEEVLTEWVFLVHKINRISNERASVYAERERTNTGLLASAATKNGWIALEECSSEKLSTESQHDSYKGKSDLYLWRGEEHHEIEAKFVRYRMFAQNQLERVRNTHEEAKRDSERSTNSGYESERKIAVSFIVPMITPKKLSNQSESGISKELQILIGAIQTELEPMLIAYTFPGPIGIWGSEHISKALGVILIGDQVA